MVDVGMSVVSFAKSLDEVEVGVEDDRIVDVGDRIEVPLRPCRY